MSLGQVNRGLNLLGQGAATAARMAPIPAAAPAPVVAEPKLGIAWGEFHQGFFSSVRTLVTWPLLSRKFLGGDYFRDCWVERRMPKRAVLAAALWHIVFLVSPLSLLTARLPHNSAFDNTEITWSGPIEDFPNLEITPAKPRVANRVEEPEKPLAPSGADAFHPRQRIVTDPVRPNHPRQTLINPRAPQIAPKFLPALPNIVQLAAVAAPARPHIEISAATLARLHPRERRVAAPAIAPALTAPRVLPTAAAPALVAEANGPARPNLDLNASATPRMAQRIQDGDSLPAPELAAQTPAAGNPNSLIALSAAPAPPKPEVALPDGNLAARVTISPEGKRAGVPGSAPNLTADAAHAAGGSSGGNSPVGVSISGGNPIPKSTAPGLSNPAAKLILPPSRSLMSSQPNEDDAAERRGSPNFAALPPGAKPEQVFAAKRVYTMAVNTANLTSASGSWILHFAELGSGKELTPSVAADLSMPIPMRKVDPKYPPELIEQNVQGEVVLYGIIRASGSVDSIQVARSLDPQLDANAKSAFAQWKFAPAAKAGTPVDIEVIAHIPFKISDDR